MNNFGEGLRNLRKMRGLSQQELADRLRVTRQTISDVERNKIFFSKSLIDKLEKELVCRVSIVIIG